MYAGRSSVRNASVCTRGNGYSVMNFLADENLPMPSVRLPRQAGHDAAAVITGAPGSTDRDVLAWAAREKRIVLTFDHDFGELIFHRRMLAPVGVVYFRFEPETPEEPGEYLLRLLGVEGLSLEERFTVVRRRRVRQRTLPRIAENTR